MRIVSKKLPRGGGVILHGFSSLTSSPSLLFGLSSLPLCLPRALTSPQPPGVKHISRAGAPCRQPRPAALRLPPCGSTRLAPLGPRPNITSCRLPITRGARFRAMTQPPPGRAPLRWQCGALCVPQGRCSSGLAPLLSTPSYTSVNSECEVAAAL